jgi:tetratricopeptide (TPR) repeat protein
LLDGYLASEFTELKMLKYIATVLTVLILAGVGHTQENKPLPRISVAWFANKTGEESQEWMAHGLHSDLTRRLLRIKGLVVADSPAFWRARNDLGLANKDLSDPQEAAKIGKALGTDKVLVGNYSKAPTGIKVVVRLVDTGTGKYVGPELSRTGPPISVGAGLALQVAGQFGIKLDDSSSVTKNLTSNPDAYENYCKGLQYKEKALQNGEDSEENGEKAIEHFIQAAKEDKKYAAPHFELGWLSVVKGGDKGPVMYRLAVKEYGKAASLYPQYAEAYNNLGLMYWQLDQQKKALKAYLKAVKLIPDYVDARFNLGRLYDTMEKYDKAITEYKKVIELNPSDAIAHNNLAVAQFNEGKSDEALKSYQAALKLKPDLKEAHLGLGLIYDSKKDTERAMRHYQKYFDLGGLDEEIRDRLDQLKSRKEE